MTDTPDRLARVGLRPDAEEVRQDAALIAALDRANVLLTDYRRNGDDAEYKAWLRQHAQEFARLHDGIGKAVPATRAGLVALARYALREPRGGAIDAPAYAALRGFMALEDRT